MLFLIISIGETFTAGIKVEFAESKHKWNFNNTNDWIKFAYIDCSKTKLIVGIKDTGNLNILKEIA